MCQTLFEPTKQTFVQSAKKQTNVYIYLEGGDLLPIWAISGSRITFFRFRLTGRKPAGPNLIISLNYNYYFINIYAIFEIYTAGLYFWQVAILWLIQSISGIVLYEKPVIFWAWVRKLTRDTLTLAQKCAKTNTICIMFVSMGKCTCLYHSKQTFFAR